MSRIVVLDSGPLALFLQRQGIAQADSIRRWVADHVARRTRFIVPEVADYEVRRELVRLNKTTALNRLDSFAAEVSDRYLPITTAAMRKAADLWADLRRHGIPTADPLELDGDVILAAQVLTAGLPMARTVVATSNVVHLSRMVPAEHWLAV